MENRIRREWEEEEPHDEEPVEVPEPENEGHALLDTVLEALNRYLARIAWTDDVQSYLPVDVLTFPDEDPGRFVVCIGKLELDVVGYKIIDDPLFDFERMTPGNVIDRFARDGLLTEN